MRTCRDWDSETQRLEWYRGTVGNRMGGGTQRLSWNDVGGLLETGREHRDPEWEDMGIGMVKRPVDWRWGSWKLGGDVVGKGWWWGKPESPGGNRGHMARDKGDG